MTPEQVSIVEKFIRWRKGELPEFWNSPEAALVTDSLFDVIAHLTETEAREAKLRKAVVATMGVLMELLPRAEPACKQTQTAFLEWALRETREASTIPHDDTALLAHDAQVRREALEEAAKWFDVNSEYVGPGVAGNLRHMAQEIKP